MKKRSSYRPYGVNPTAHLAAMMGAACMSRSDVLKRGMNLSDAVEKASRAQATKEDWRLIFDCINIIEQLARMKVLAGLDVLEALQATVMGIMDRQRSAGTKALRAAELADLRGFAADYTTVLRGVTQQQYMTAQRAVEDRIRRLLSSETIPASLHVVEAVE
jgi:hypothetical protein